jgi:outer membrane protein assembly factor BamB
MVLAAEGRLFMVCYNTSQIHELDPDTGVILNSFPTPEPCLGEAGLAYGEGRMFFINGLGTNTVYEISPEDGTPINSFAAPPGAGPINGLGFSGDRLFALDPTNLLMQVLNPNTGEFITAYSIPVFAGGGGCSFAGTRGSFFCSDYNTFPDPNPIWEFDAITGDGLGLFNAPELTVIWGLGFSCSRQTLFLGDIVGYRIYEVNPDNGDVINSFYSPCGVFIGALAADEYFLPCLVGDANEDGVVDALDLQAEKQIIFGELPPTCGADANEDGYTNVLDLVKIKLIIIGS